jgi:hypothetical protein
MTTRRGTVLWMFGGLAFLALAAQWLRARGIAGPGLEEGLAAFYLVALGIIGFGVLFFWFRSSLRSGNPAAVLLLILQLLMTFLLGRAVRRLLGGGCGGLLGSCIS